MVIIFAGRKYAREKEEILKSKVLKLREKGIVPKLVSILVGDDRASKLYVGLKKKAAERIGVEVEVVGLAAKSSVEEILQTIKRVNADEKVQGMIVQLPLPERLDQEKEKIINSIDPKKDVDGLREDSPYVHPTAKAILQIVKIAGPAKTICVVGERGMVGSSLIKEIKKTKLQLVKDSGVADILVSATGQPNLITPDRVKTGAVVIDAGSPKGDVDPAVALRANFMTPVPGGVGPVTISCLLENLIIASGG